MMDVSSTTSSEQPQQMCVSTRSLLYRLSWDEFYDRYRTSVVLRNIIEDLFKCIGECCTYLAENLETESLLDEVSNSYSIEPQTMVALSMLVTLIYEVTVIIINLSNIEDET